MHHVCHCNPCRCDKSGPRRSAAPAASGAPQRAPSQRQRCANAGEVAESPVGAHLVTPRRGYTHHGIYAGADRVVHYSGLSRGLRSGPVEEVTFARFANGRPVAIRCRGPMPFDESEIVRRAQVDRWLRSPLLAAVSVVQRARVVLGSLSDRLLANHEGVADLG